VARFAVSLLALAATLAAPAFALDPATALTQYGHERWTTGNGLPQNTIAAIAQTKDGYLWLATPVGLARFDGVRFVLFDTANSALPHNKVWSLFAARDGALWIGTDGGGVTRLKDGRMHTFSTQSGLGNDIVREIDEGQDGTVWVATLGGGVTGLRDERVVSTLGKKEGLPSDLAWGLHVDRAGILWIGTNGGGLARYDGKSVRTFTDKDGLAGMSVRCLHEDRESALWIGTNAGLSQLKDGRFTTFTEKDGLAADVVRDIHEDRDGNLWVGTTAGLSRRRGERFENLKAPAGLAGNFVRALLEDREGSLWIGSFAGGLDRLRDVRFTVYGTAEGLPDDYVHAILETSDGSVWIAPHTGGLSRLQHDRVVTYTEKDGVPDRTVMSLAESKDGSLWVGTNGGGVVRFAGGRFESLGGAPLPSPWVKALAEDDTGTLWIGTTEGLVARRGGEVELLTAEAGLPDNLVRTLLAGREGRVWIGTSRGLACWRAGKVQAWTASEGLPSAGVESLHEDESGTLWIGTNGAGLARMKNGAFRTVTAKNGLADDIVYRILDDGDGGFWMTSPRGIARVERAELEAVLDGKAPRFTSVLSGPDDGLRSSECTGGFHPAGWRAKDGRLWFPTAGGAAAVNPRAQGRHSLAPTVLVEEVIADGRIADVADLRFPAGTERLTFRYTGLSLLVPSRVHFRYRLEGFDHEWIEAGSARVAQYTNVPPGHYRFRVKAGNADGVWNEDGATAALSLAPHFHQTYWFYSLCLGLAAGLVWSVVKRRESGLRAREAELQARVQERTSALTQEITERRRAEEALRESEERYALAVRGANDGVWDWDLESSLIYFSPRWKSILGHHEDEVGESPDEWLGRVHPDDLDRVKAGIAAHCEGRSPHFEDEHRVRHRDGSYRWVLARGFAVRGPDGKPSRLIGVQTDVTDRRSYDPLTGLPNRALFVERLSRALLRAQRQPEYRVGVLFLDLDRFKVVNDSLGHLAGDRLLVTMSQALQACVRPGDMVARFGGDEFAVFVDNMSDLGDAIRVAERIQKALQTPVVLEGSEIFTSVSIGIATSATPYDAAEDLLRDADTAMYRAKANGRARYEVFDAAMRAHVMEQLEVESDLRRAVERGELTLHYQPVVCLRTGNLLGFEALVRWPHPRRGLVGPDDFIGVAEDTGLIVPLGYWVLREACAQLHRWHREFRSDVVPVVSVNISARQLVDEDFVDRVREILQETALAPEHLNLEITETVLMESGGHSTEMLAALKADGVRLHLDDFGTGYSSLSYLHKFPVDALKIDHSFVRQIGTASEIPALVHTIVTMARNMDIAAVAEGVETLAQLVAVRAVGCDRAQGHYFAEPLDRERAGALLASHWRWPLPDPPGLAV